MTKFVCIREFERRHEAGRAKSVLDAEAIEAVLSHDDAGGWEDGPFNPTWAKARLMVRTEDAQRARQALESVGL